MPPTHLKKPLQNFATMGSNVFARLGSITITLSTFAHFKALFLAVSVEICLLVITKT